MFLPWAIDPSYRAPLPDGFTMTAEEKALAGLHGLDAEQIAWRRAKISQRHDDGSRRHSVRDVEGDPITHKLEEGETARQVAARLTLKILRALLERDGGVAEFRRPIKYQKLVY